jgi:hypothetical protein
MPTTNSSLDPVELLGALRADNVRQALGIGVTVARLTLNQLVQVRILDPQFS